ncbi:N-acetylmuramoyl-L-alanine amidase [Gloeobacter morelensis]|uniref:N-acetylmuramoyl-L-alanine amidase n=1 Tax=Gloeobacter morelensis MG652769 TaxID=2781736 RepID=A0ABY3PH73_9CYAN|nr:peptidoglycan recognition family protein [Gloeobacter morelensis]UFP93026.1 N-acetylmuramoyl-L-alanine amidase [Gloeobacter morelensis MG652769]
MRLPLLSLLLALGLFCTATGATEPRVLDRPIPFGPARRALTLDYIRLHYDPEARDIAIIPRMVVVHWTGDGNLTSAFATFTPDQLPSARADIQKGGALNVSAHFVVDRDGTIYRLMDEKRLARHVIGLNWMAIGIENIGGPRRALTDAQLAANAWLVRDLAARHPIDYLIGHHEYGRFRGSPLWRERQAGYFTGKSDPGANFMARLRARLQELKLKDRP